MGGGKALVNAYYRSAEQLSKKKPGSVDFASTGAGSAPHLAGELFNQRAGIDMTHVPEEPVSGPSGDRVGAQSG